MRTYTVDGVTFDKEMVSQLREWLINHRDISIIKNNLSGAFDLSLIIAFLSCCIEELEDNKEPSV